MIYIGGTSNKDMRFSVNEKRVSNERRVNNDKQGELLMNYNDNNKVFHFG